MVLRGVFWVATGIKAKFHLQIAQIKGNKLMLFVEPCVTHHIMR